MTFPNVKNDAGQKQYSPCFCEGVAGADDAFTRTLMPGVVQVFFRCCSGVVQVLFRCSSGVVQVFFRCSSGVQVGVWGVKGFGGYGLLQRFFKVTQHEMMRELKMTSGLLGEISCIHHVELGVKLYAPIEKSFPIQMKYIDGYQNNIYITGCIV